jgi:hypothetical protein
VHISRVRKHVATKPPWSDPYHVPQYWMIFFLMRLIHVRRMATWCLHKFPCNAHSHVQQTYLVKGNGTLYIIFRCCLFCTIHAWPISFESSISWVIWVWRINVGFSMLIFTICFTTLFLINQCFFILTMCM